MEKLISCCGIDCASCEARIATMTNNNELRKQTAEKWTKMYNSDITTEMINCTGCREKGVKISHCNTCEIKKCAESKNYKTCGECSDLETCQTVSFVLKNVPDALSNLKMMN